MKLVILGVISLIVFANEVYAEQKPNKPSLIVDEFLKSTGIPSVSYTFFDLEGNLESKAFGMMDLSGKRKAETTTIYDVGSNAKIITAVAILKLVDKGLVNLNAPVNSYLKTDISALDTYSENPVLVKHLLNHLSGIPTLAWLSKAWEPSMFIDRQSIYDSIDLVAKPGERYQYCNVCFLIANDIIEQVSGESYTNYILNNILKPAGVVNQGFLIPVPQMYSNMAFPYHMRFATPYPTDFYISATYGAGGAWFTSEQLAKVLRYIFASENSNGALSSASFESLITEYTTIENYNGGYGLGVGLEHYESGVYPFHQGSMPGFISQYIYDYKTKRGLVLSANVTAGPNVAAQTVWLRDKLFSQYVNDFDSPNSEYTVDKRTPIPRSKQTSMPSPTGHFQSDDGKISMSIFEIGEQYILENPAKRQFTLARLDTENFILTTEEESLQIRFKDNQPTKLDFISPSGETMIVLTIQADK